MEESPDKFQEYFKLYSDHNAVHAFLVLRDL